MPGAIGPSKLVHSFVSSELLFSNIEAPFPNARQPTWLFFFCDGITME